MKQEEISLNTKKTLSESLKNAMRKKPFSKITVKDITEECNLNRNTFYYHFEDVYALLRWTLDHEAIQVVQKFNLLTDYEGAISFAVDYLGKNELILNCALDSIGRKELKRLFFKEFCDIVCSILTEAQTQHHVTLNEDYKVFLINFYTEAMAGVMIQWITKEYTTSKEELITYLSNTVKYSLLGIFKKSSLCYPEI